jgi:hypothetical protein
VTTEALVVAPQDRAVEVMRAMDNLKAVRTFIAGELVDGTDYGPIPGTGKIKVKREVEGRTVEVEVEKKVMLLSGAQKVVMFFNAYPEYDVTPREMENGHIEYSITARLMSRTTDKVIGLGVGSCSTMESKYRFRSGERVCPKCKAPAIIKGKADFGGGWLCWSKKGGCGAKFADKDPTIEGQTVGKIENENIHDQRNTVLKMAKKRALVDASIGLGCLADLFTQDIEDMDVFDLGPARAAQKTEESRPAPAPAGPTAEPPAQAPPAQKRTYTRRPKPEPFLTTEQLAEQKKAEEAKAAAEPLDDKLGEAFDDPEPRENKAVSSEVEALLKKMAGDVGSEKTYQGLLAKISSYRNLFVRCGAEAVFLEAKKMALGRLFSTGISQETKLDIPNEIPATHNLEFFAADEAAMKGGVRALREVFFSATDTMRSAGLFDVWKDWCNALREDLVAESKS